MFAYSFPPADDFVSIMSHLDYNKLWKQFVIIIATVAAIIVGTAVWFYNRAKQWYNNGGKEQMIVIINRVALFINNKTGMVDKISAHVVKFNNRVEMVYHNLTDLSEGMYKM